ncbi:hypothetical protein BH688_07730 [Kushneria phosphatilytica]|uniref:Uncharacterized protein n=1 Tax=Kushneria phosphatilytica TaxID=657387 RepID=A0A1S1NZJ1_9GAMM|nr:hypothetical protein BH688_07730 [Kushneria phosphatilytica]QEL12222.1 hypothetical protein FY550_14490 [Kushneria phosphatilytica]
MSGLLGRVLGAIPIRVWLIIAGTGLAGAGGWYAWHEYRTALTDAATARQARDTALAESAQRQLVIDALWDNAQRLETQRRALANTKAALERVASDRLEQIRSLQHDNEQIRQWADTRLPDRVIRLRNRPAVTGAANYRQALRDAEPLHPAGEPSHDQR